MNFRIICRPVSLLFCTLLCCSTGIVSAQGAVDNNNTTATATTLPLNISVPGRIDPADDVDYFRIRITFQTLVLIFTRDDLNTVGRLINSVGAVLQSDDNSGRDTNFRIEYNDFKPGIYYIEVSSSGTETGDYRLHVSAEGEGDHGDTIETTTDLPLNASVLGMIDPASDVDYFSIETSTPTVIAIYTVSNLNTIGSLYDDDEMNTLLASDDNSGKNTNFLILYPLVDSGTYYIEVSSTGTETGDYTLRIDSDVGEDDHGNTIAEATTVTLNTTVSGTIAPGIDIDYFRLDISTTAFVTIYTTGYTTDGLDTAGSLQDKNGVELPSNDISSIFNFRISAPLNPGTYYIGVEGSNSLRTGDYVLHVDIATDIGLNSSVSGTIDPAGDVDYFSIDISTTAFVTIYTTGGLNTAGSLQDNNGVELPSNDISLSLNFRINFLLNPGTYYIGVEESNFFRTGDYVLHVDIATDIGLNSSASGTIDLAGDVDYFRIVISTTVLVSILITGDLNDVLNTGSPYNVQNIFLLTPGTYSFRVGELDSRSTGSYTLHLRAVTVTPLPLNTSVSGTIDPAGDVDYFSLEIDTQTNVNIFTTDNLDTMGTLYDGTINFLQDDDNSGRGDNFLISDRLDSGTYYIRVESPASLSTGNYVLRVDDDAAPIASLEVVGNDIRLKEGGSATLLVTLDRSFEQATTIQIVTAGAATLGIDYTIDVNPVMLSRGSTSAETTLRVIDDSQPEPDETIILTLEAGNELIIDDEPGAQLTLTIEDVILLFKMKVFLEGAQ